MKYLDLYFFTSYVFYKKLIFIAHSKKSNNHDD